MPGFFHSRFVAAAVLAASFTSIVDAAVPLRSFQLSPRANYPISVTPECETLYVGQKATDGNVCLSVVGDSLIVQYTQVTGYSYNEAHVWIGVGKPPSPPAPGQFPYTTDKGYCVIAEDKYSVTCTIPLASLSKWDLCTTEFSIAAHAALGGETGWRGGECINPNCHPWAMYSKFTFVCDESKPSTSLTETSTTEYPTETSSTTKYPTETSSTAKATTKTKEETTKKYSSTESPSVTTVGKTITKTSVVCITTTSCSAAKNSKSCSPVTKDYTVKYLVVETVTVPCETSTYSESGTTKVSIVTLEPTTAYITYSTYTAEAAAPTLTYAPAPGNSSVAAKPTSTYAAAFTGGASTLSGSLGYSMVVLSMVAVISALLL